MLFCIVYGCLWDTQRRGGGETECYGPWSPISSLALDRKSSPILTLEQRCLHYLKKKKKQSNFLGPCVFVDSRLGPSRAEAGGEAVILHQDPLQRVPESRCSDLSPLCSLRLRTEVRAVCAGISYPRDINLTPLTLPFPQPWLHPLLLAVCLSNAHLKVLKKGATEFLFNQPLCSTSENRSIVCSSN